MVRFMMMKMSLSVRDERKRDPAHFHFLLGIDLCMQVSVAGSQPLPSGPISF